jgi:hypothetical protein
LDVEQSFYGMQIKRKRTETINETASLFIVKKTTADARNGWCRQCEREVFWITPGELKLFGIATVPENGAIHTNGDEICSRSLIEEIKKGEKQ